MAKANMLTKKKKMGTPTILFVELTKSAEASRTAMAIYKECHMQKIAMV